MLRYVPESSQGGKEKGKFKMTVKSGVDNEG